ncbi:MAG: Fic family protein, partial [Candidatus Adiutrix sp.]
ERKMKEFFDWCAGEAQNLHPIERAARVHADFVTIHPFIDGNGRTARLLMNLELVKSGYPIAIVRVADRTQYYNNLNQASANGDYLPFVKQVCNLVEDSFNDYSKVLRADLNKGIEDKAADNN